ncbi:DUF3801 domain-containing protein [Bifidobacterium sp. SO1]|uniref:DUF3801 domain-containing protein n=1 Tax=Bifidobacterium sp. SO1 TaxID=2809029 RepID=UPI001BDD0CE7|nr:DUF3801 domain-containing protein [Bifidobacterium sp. SO1]MBT1160916.1 PcfB family protein [Bifidobacterium sp. SO1]
MAAEEQAQDYAIRAFEGGARISVEVGKFLGSKLFQLFGLGIKVAANVIHDIRHSGQVSAKTLQKDNTSLKVEEIGVEQKNSIVRELKKQGIAFHIERDKTTGKIYLHFSGNDADEVRHAVDKIVARLSQETERREQRQSQTEPERTEPAEHGNEPQSQTQEMPSTQQREQPATEEMPTVEQWDRDSPDNPGFDFTTVDIDPNAAIIAASLAERGVQFRQERINEHTQRFTYPANQATKVAQMLEDLIDRTPNLDWNRVNTPNEADRRTAETREPERDADINKTEPTHRKTKAETIQNIKQRAQQRVEQSKGAPKQTHSRTR